MNAAAIKKCVENLENLDPNNPDAYTKAISFYKGAGQIPFLILDFDNLPFHIIRTRTHDNDVLFEDFSDVGLTPAKFVSGYGRCNVPGQPVFYGSDYRPTSYMELLEYWVKEKKGQYLYATTSKWKISNVLSALIVTSPFKENRTAHFDKSHGEVLDKFINSFEGEVKEAMIIFYKFLFDRFRKPAKGDLQTYIITSAYSNLGFDNQSKRVDAIFYPSVPFQGTGVNLAIQGNYDFENNFKLELVARSQFERLDTKPEPTFQEVDSKQSKSIDEAKKKIIWK